MSDWLNRTVMLYGHECVEKLKRSRVAVFGLGGVGGHCAEALCRTGVGCFMLVDGDVVDITNINRQIIATHKTIGSSKVQVMADRMREINPHVRCTTAELFYLPKTADSIDLSQYDYVVDAVDTMTAKLTLVTRCQTAGVRLISSMGAANKRNPAAFEVADIYETSVCPLARIMRRELRKLGVKSLKVVYSKETPIKPPDASNQQHSVPASCSFVPSAAGLIIASEVVRDLTGT